MYDLKVINTRPLHCPRGGYGFFVLIPNNHRFLMILVFFLHYKGIKSYCILCTRSRPGGQINLPDVIFSVCQCMIKCVCVAMIYHVVL